MPNIVTVNVAQQLAPIPSTLQKMGCLVSQGGTALSKFQFAFLTQLSDLGLILATPAAISGITWLSGVATVTAAAPHGLTVGQTVWVDIQGAAPAAYNGSYLATVTTSTQFTFVKPSNPGALVTAGTWAPRSVAELDQMASTFFAQGYQQGVYVLELGKGSVAEGVAALGQYLTANPNTAYMPGLQGYFYSYLVPRAWDAHPDFLALAAEYQATTKRTYFFVTTTLATHAAYSNLQKAVFALVETPNVPALPSAIAISSGSWTAGRVTLNAPGATIAVGQWFKIQGATPAAYNGWKKAVEGTSGATIVFEEAADPGTLTTPGSIAPSYFASSPPPSTEFTAASALWATLNYSPSDTNKTPPLAFTYVYGVTPWPPNGAGAIQNELKTANTNFIGTGAEGGISNAALFWGRLKDGKPFNYWYAADWVAINTDIDVANAVINGSNTPINPLYYNQNGIDRLQAVIAGVIQRAVTFGLVLFQPKQTALTGPELTEALATNKFAGYSVVNAVPFIPYSINNPSDYADGRYTGFSVTFTPLRGFEAITINLVVSQFVVQ
ncbi:MAG: hypothetical protein N2444_00065 [Methylocystis sp.]|nr:hypothetical protein [Methylocystis sp.]